MTKQTQTVNAETMIGTTENGTIITAPVTRAVNTPLPPMIQATKDYSMFSFVKGNRRVNAPKLKRLKSSMKQVNACHLYPIIVSSNYAILDGQHRYLACADEWASRVQSLKDTYSFYKDRGFILALVTMWKHEDYDHERFMKKVSSAGSKVIKATSRLEYLRQLEGLYNFKVRKTTKKVRFF
jgi:ferredoxin-NADP reductase